MPRTLTDTPDFHGDYTLELRGVRAEIGETPALAGVLPTARWTWAGMAAWLAATLDAPKFQRAF